MGAHTLEELKNPLGFIAMATIGCFVGHIFMYPLGLFELSGKIGFGIADLFNMSSGFEDSVLDFDLDDQALELDTHEDTAHDHSEEKAFYTKGEEGFEDCVADGGSQHFHGHDLVCHPAHP